MTWRPTHTAKRCIEDCNLIRGTPLMQVGQWEDDAGKTVLLMIEEDDHPENPWCIHPDDVKEIQC